MPVDQYIGGVEARDPAPALRRLFYKGLSDMDLLDVQEPFQALFTQGMVTRDGAKMSKSKGNTVGDRRALGADTARCYILFIGPPDQDADWSDDGVEGVHRFLARLWRLAIEAADGAGGGGSGGAGQPNPPADPRDDDLALLRKAHWAIEKVTGDMAGRFAFNTAIAAIMELVNECSRRRDGVAPGTLRFALATAASLVFPFAPHLGAEVYERLTGRRVWEEPWPQADPALLERDTYELVCQVNGKVRDRVEAPAGAGEAELVALCRETPNVQAHVDGREVVKEVVVPGKLVNLVVR